MLKDMQHLSKSGQFIYVTDLQNRHWPKWCTACDLKKRKEKKKGSHPRNNLENGITDYKGADKESTKDTVNNLDVDRH